MVFEKDVSTAEHGLPWVVGSVIDFYCTLICKIVAAVCAPKDGMFKNISDATLEEGKNPIVSITTWNVLGYLATLHLLTQVVVYDWLVLHAWLELCGL